MTTIETNEELESYWEWWSMAGIDYGYTEEPSGWQEPVSPDAKTNDAPPLKPAHKQQPAPLKTLSRPPEPVAAPDKPTQLPQSFDDILPWWKETNDLTMVSGNGARIMPVLNNAAPLLIISDMPDEDDSDQLFSGASGRLLHNILNAVQIESETAAFLPIWPQYSLAPDMELDRLSYWSEIVQHLIGLIQPDSIMLCGKIANLAVTGNDLPENRRSLQNINHNQRSIPASASFHPRTLLARPSLKRVAWTDWLRFRESLHEIGAAKP